MTFQTQTALGGITIAERIASLQSAFAERRAKRKVYTTTLRELSGLSNRDLRDLGISRSMIKQISYDAAYGK